MSSVSSRLGAGFGMFGRKLNQTLNQASAELAHSGWLGGHAEGGGPSALPPRPTDIGDNDDQPPAAATAAAPEDGADGSPSGRLGVGEGLMNTTAREALAELRSGSTTLSDTQAAVLRHQAGQRRGRRHALAQLHFLLELPRALCSSPRL